MAFFNDNSQIILSDESLQQIQQLFNRLEYLLSPLGTFSSERVKNAIVNILRGEMSLQDLPGARNKIACKLMCELIKYIQLLEAQLNDELPIKKDSNQTNKRCSHIPYIPTIKLNLSNSSSFINPQKSVGSICPINSPP